MCDLSFKFQEYSESKKEKKRNRVEGNVIGAHCQCHVPPMQSSVGFGYELSLVGPGSQALEARVCGHQKGAALEGTGWGDPRLQVRPE